MAMDCGARRECLLNKIGKSRRLAINAKSVEMRCFGVPKPKELVDFMLLHKLFPVVFRELRESARKRLVKIRAIRGF